MRSLAVRSDTTTVLKDGLTDEAWLLTCFAETGSSFYVRGKSTVCCTGLDDWQASHTLFKLNNLKSWANVLKALLWHLLCADRDFGRPRTLHWGRDHEPIICTRARPPVYNHFNRPTFDPGTQLKTARRGPNTIWAASLLY